jgi:HAD superfamily hydrolase (TIGR01490 family)
MGDYSGSPRREAAFFDLDKTVVAKSSTLAFGPELYREGLISPALVLKGAYAQLAYQVLGANEARMEKSRTQLLEVIRGWETERVQRLVRETLQEVIDPIIYQEALDLFAEHRRAGRELYLASSSSLEVVRPLAEYLGVPNVLATEPGIDAEGRYDGTLQFYCYGQDKAQAVLAEARVRELDLSASYAYTDSVSDLPMLEAVGHPVAVNPDKELRAAAAEREWQVRDFTRQVALRSRLSQMPRPPAQVLAGAGALGAVAAASWTLYRRGHRSPGVELLQAGLERAHRGTALRPAPTRGPAPGLRRLAGRVVSSSRGGSGSRHRRLRTSSTVAGLSSAALRPSS